MTKLRTFILCATVFLCLLMPVLISQADDLKLEKSEIQTAGKVIGLDFTAAEIDTMIPDLEDLAKDYKALRARPLDNALMPALQFNPLPSGFTLPAAAKGEVRFSDYSKTRRPKKLEDAAFYSIGQLAHLIKSRQVTSVELTKMYLQRLKRLDKKLHCVITMTEDLALMQAQRADEEIAAGKYRGPLHGIPYGAKDLLAVKGYQTTWGAEPYKDQMIDKDAAVIRLLEDAGAVLIAKLTLGALAWGDVWYDGKTRNPWNLKQGSSGSSAGSASATAAGAVAFAIGSETWGSIVSPSTRCGTTGLRPTYGRVSRVGAMALSWSMDKLGPICRTVEDCALVFSAIYGPDPEDPTVYDVPFNYTPQIDLKSLKVGYLKSDFEDDYAFKSHDSLALQKLRSMGVELVPLSLPDLPFRNISFILSAEAAAAFDLLTRSGRDDLLVRQVRNAWPNVFRQARLIPAVEYINANRIRTELINQFDQQLKDLDLYLSPSFSGNLLMTNLTGHPCVVLPNGFAEDGTPTSITFMGKLFDEGRLMAFARAYQEATDFHLKHPSL